MSGDRRQERPEEATREHLKYTLEHMLAAGRSVREMAEATVERFGERVIPELEAFLHEVQRGEVRIKGLSRGAREALFGMQLSAEEREALIRKAAYYRAERRGFAGGSPEEDWREAEREVDQMLERDIGLVPRGREALAEAGEALERELGDIRRVLSAWLGGRSGAGEAPAGGEAQAGGPAPEAVEPVKAAKKKAAEKKTAKKKTAKKKAAKKKAAKKKAAKEGAKKKAAKKKAGK